MQWTVKSGSSLFAMQQDSATLIYDLNTMKVKKIEQSFKRVQFQDWKNAPSFISFQKTENCCGPPYWYYILITKWCWKEFENFEQQIETSLGYVHESLTMNKKIVSSEKSLKEQKTK